MRVCVGNVVGVYLVQFSLFLQVSALASHWLEDCGNITPTPEENNQYTVQCQLLLVPCYSSKSIHFYQCTIILRLWSARMTKISQRNSHQPRERHFLQYKIIGASVATLKLTVRRSICTRLDLIHKDGWDAGALLSLYYPNPSLGIRIQCRMDFFCWGESNDFLLGSWDIYCET